MSSVAKISLEPFFIDSVKGRIFALYFPAQSHQRGSLLYLPPFAEEMNRCRALVAEQARSLAQLGYACLLLDLYGVGESEGELADADWETWCLDTRTAVDWLEARTQRPVILWGCRLGALLAADVANRDPNRFRQLLLWQPVTNGKLFMNQYLRLRVTSLMDRGLPAETTDQIRENLAAGAIVDVAGYPLSGHLTQSIEATAMTHFTALKGVDMAWFENVSEPEGKLSPASQKVVAELLSQENQVDVQPFIDPPIWQLHKRDSAVNLLEKTTGLFGGTA